MAIDPSFKKIVAACDKTRNITIKYRSCTKIFEDEGEGEEIIKKESFSLDTYAMTGDKTGIVFVSREDETDAIFIPFSAVLEITAQPEREEKKILRKKESVFEQLE